MKKQLIAIFSLIILFTSSITAQATTSNDARNDNIWPTGPNVFAEAAIVMEASTGLILYEKNIHNTYYPASITKIMTGLLAIENSSLSEVVKFSRSAIFDVDLRSSRIGIDVGEELTMQQCLYGILLESANEVTHATAEHIAGSVPAFAEMMNERAKNIGCLNTNFVNPHGLPDSSHISTAYDMALITREAMKNETFRKITGTRTYQIPPTNIQKETRYLRNHHRFILKQNYLYDGAIGGKTGYTSVAKYTLVSIAKRGDLELICVIMKDDTFEHQYTDTQKLFDYAFDNFSIYPIAELESNKALHESPLFTRFNPLLSKSESPLVIDGKGFLVLPKEASFEDAQKEVSFHSDSSITKGSNIIGQISFTYNDKYVGGANIIYNYIERPTLAQNKINPIQQPNITDIFTETSPDSSLRPIIIGFIIGFFVLGFILYYLLVERPRIKRRNAYYKKRQNRRKYMDDDYLDIK